MKHDMCVSYKGMHQDMGYSIRDKIVKAHHNLNIDKMDNTSMYINLNFKIKESLNKYKSS